MSISFNVAHQLAWQLDAVRPFSSPHWKQCVFCTREIYFTYPPPIIFARAKYKSGIYQYGEMKRLTEVNCSFTSHWIHEGWLTCVWQQKSISQSPESPFSLYFPLVHPLLYRFRHWQYFVEFWLQTGNTRLHYCLSSKVDYTALWPLALPVQVQVHKQNSASLTCTHSTSVLLDWAIFAAVRLPVAFKLEMVVF